ncbi:DUF1684 domain-containing protein [bacterium]|nr:DUF1684 domain-containing protein [bacterium]
MNRLLHPFYIFTVVLLFITTSCEKSTPENKQESEISNPVIAERAEHNQQIKDAEIGPFTAISQLSLHDEEPLYITHNNHTLELSKTPIGSGDIPLMQVTWNMAQGKITAFSNNSNVFKKGTQPIGKEPVSYAMGDTLYAGKFLIQIYYGKSSARLMVFNPILTKRQEFDGLKYYPYSDDYVVTADIFRIANPEIVTMATSLGLEKRYVRAAELRFTVKDTLCSLNMFVPVVDGINYGFIPFTDLTTGDETYGGGRYLDIEPLPNGETVTLDLNKVYNPYCAYTTYYNCPVPPTENSLPVAIRAGEKSYKTEVH